MTRLHEARFERTQSRAMAARKWERVADPLWLRALRWLLNLVAA